MNLFLRQFIILLLLLLQGVSPLVHAHVHQDGGINGLHIDVDGFSTLSKQSPQNASLERVDHSGTVIGIRSAIQQKNQLIKHHPDTGLDLQSLHFSAPCFIENQLLYRSTVFADTVLINLSTIAPRAPPFSTPL